MELQVKGAKLRFASDILDRFPSVGNNLTVLNGNSNNTNTKSQKQYLFITADKPARAIIVVPTAYLLKSVPYNIDPRSSDIPDETAMQNYGYFCLPKQTRQIRLRWTNSSYQMSNGVIYENANGTLHDIDGRAYLSANTEQTFDISANNDEFVWLILTIKKGSDGTEDITGLTIQELGFSMDVELRNGAVYHFGIANE
jgi:hypothetical protein